MGADGDASGFDRAARCVNFGESGFEAGAAKASRPVLAREPAALFRTTAGSDPSLAMIDPTPSKQRARMSRASPRQNDAAGAPLAALLAMSLAAP